MSTVAQIATHRVPSGVSTAHCKRERGYALRSIMGMRPPTMEECDLCKRRDAVLLQDIHLHKGGPIHAHWRLTCQPCPKLRSAAFPSHNTLKHKTTYTPIPFTIPKGPSSKHVFITLDSAAQLGLPGRSNEPFGKGKERKAGTNQQCNP